MTEGFTDEKNDGACLTAMPPKMTWKELKKHAEQLGAVVDYDYDDETIVFGMLEFGMNGIISWFGEVICPQRSYKQMKAIMDIMFGEK